MGVNETVNAIEKMVGFRNT